MVPSVLILGFYEKIQQKKDPEQAPFHFLFFFFPVIEKRQLAPRWNEVKVTLVLAEEYLQWQVVAR